MSDSDDEIVPSVCSWEVGELGNSDNRFGISKQPSRHSQRHQQQQQRWWKNLWPSTFFTWGAASSSSSLSSPSCISKTSPSSSAPSKDISLSRILSSCSERFLSCSGRFDTKQHQHMRSQSFDTSSMSKGSMLVPESNKSSFDARHVPRFSTKWFQKDFGHGNTSFTR